MVALVASAAAGLLMPVASPAVSRADAVCPVGMYWDAYTAQCLYYDANVYVNPPNPDRRSRRPRRCRGSGRARGRRSGGPGPHGSGTGRPGADRTRTRGTGANACRATGAASVVAQRRVLWWRMAPGGGNGGDTPETRSCVPRPSRDTSGDMLTRPQVNTTDAIRLYRSHGRGTSG